MRKLADSNYAARGRVRHRPFPIDPTSAYVLS